MAGKANPTGWIRVPNGGTPEQPTVYTAIREALQESADSIRTLQSQVDGLKPSTGVAGAATQIFVSDGGSGGGSGGGGSVTSVDLALSTEANNFLSVSGGPIVTAGSITLGLDTQTTNKVFASPNGSTGTPTFRSLVAADIPDISATYLTVTTAASTYVSLTGSYSNPSWITSLAGSKISGNISGNAANVTGVVAIANGGTGQTTALAGFNALSPLATNGDLLYFNGTNNAAFAPNATATKKFLSQTSSTLSWAQVSASDIQSAATFSTSSDTNVTLTTTGGTGAVLATTSVQAGWAGQLAVSRGGTGLSTAPTNGQLLIGNGTNYTLAALTAGTGITITNGAGSIQIDASGMTNPMTTIGDMIYASNTATPATPARLGLTTGGVLYGGMSAPAWTATTDLTWDQTNKRLGIGQSSPTTVLDIVHTVAGNAAVNMSNSSTNAAASARFILNNSATSGGLQLRSTNHATEASDTVLYSSANNLRFYTGGNLRASILSTGNVGIGTASPSYPLHVASTITSTSGTVLSYSSATIAPSASPATGGYFGQYSLIQSSGANLTGTLTAVYGEAYNSGSSTLTWLRGVSSAVGIGSSATGNVTSAAAFYAFSPVQVSGGTGTYTTAYGVYIGAQKVASVTGVGYGVYAPGTSDLNTLAGKLRIGSTTDPTNALDVTGDVTISGDLAVNGGDITSSASGLNITATNASTGVVRTYAGGSATSNERVRVALAKNLTNNTATTVISLTLGTNTYSGCSILYTIEASNATDYQAKTGVLHVAAARAGLAGSTQILDSVTTAAVTAGTLASTWAATYGSNVVDVTLNANSSLTPTTLRVRYVVFNNGSNAFT